MVGRENKGTVILIPIPYTDLSGSKVRPSVVLADTGGEDILLAFVSSQKQKTRYALPVEANEPAFSGSGLRETSYVRADKIFTIDRKLAIGVLGILPVEKIQKLDVLLKKVLCL